LTVRVPVSSETEVSAAFIPLLKGDLPAARRALTAGLSGKARNEGLQLVAALEHLQNRDWEESAKALEEKPSHPELAELHGAMLRLLQARERGPTLEALSAQTVPPVLRSEHQALFGLALSQAGQLDSALQRFEKALQTAAFAAKQSAAVDGLNQANESIFVVGQEGFARKLAAKVTEALRAELAVSWNRTPDEFQLLLDNLAYGEATLGRSLLYSQPRNLALAQEWLDKAARHAAQHAQTTGVPNWNASSIHSDLALLALEKTDFAQAAIHAEAADAELKKLEAVDGKDEGRQAEVDETFAKLLRPQGGELASPEYLNRRASALRNYVASEQPEQAARLEAELPL